MKVEIIQFILNKLLSYFPPITEKPEIRKV